MDPIRVIEYFANMQIEREVDKAVADPMVDRRITRLNLEQLENFENSNGEDLADVGGEYSIVTQNIKGVGPRDITLRDTGDFWRSFALRSINAIVEIVSNPFKEGVNILDRWRGAEGLNTVNTKIANEIIAEQIIDNAEKAIPNN